MEGEADLLAAARAGDARAVEALIAAYQGQIYRYSLAMCRDAQDAGDVLQETLLSLARGVEQVRGETIHPWLYTVARSHCAKRRRRRSQAPRPSDVVPMEAMGETLADPGATPEGSLDAAELHRALQAAIQGLEPMYREVLLLRDVEGYSAAEVASALGLGEAAVKSRLHRARLAVRQALAPALEAPAQPAPGGTCPDVLRQLSRKLEGDFDAGTCAELEAHVASCPRCKQRCESLSRTLALCRSSPSPSVPEDLQRKVRAALQVFLISG